MSFRDDLERELRTPTLSDFVRAVCIALGSMLRDGWRSWRRRPDWQDAERQRADDAVARALARMRKQKGPPDDAA